MKKVEITNIGAVSSFKVGLYVSIIPFGLLALIGVILIPVGVFTGETELLFVGISYIFMSGFTACFSSLIYMLMSWLYNKLAKKFGGLEITIKEIDEPQPSATYAEKQAG